MSHRRRQKEALRREREERERRAREEQQRKRMVGFGAAGLLVVAAIVALVVVAAGGNGGGGEASAEVLPNGGSVPEQQVFELDEAARAAGCELKSSRASSRTHTRGLDTRVNYETNPPTSGRHYAIPADDGAYTAAPQDEELVHSLEHGRVIVWFRPSLPEDQRADLKALFDEDSYQMLLVPRRDLPYAVAASAWNREPEPNGTGRLLSCEEMSEQVFDALRTFRDEHRSNGPEPIP